jgi:glycine/D-amino acid oxidase-like deaminating enzyme
MMTTSNQSFDVLIVGGGISGCLAAARVRLLKPDAKIGILERDAWLGGRLRRGPQNGYGNGLNLVSDSLWQFVTQTFQDDPEVEFPTPNYTLNQVGVLAAGELKQYGLNEAYGKAGVRAIGGLAAFRDWENFEDMMARNRAQEEGLGEIITHYWNLPRKHPSSIVLETYAPMLGIPDLWTTSPRILSNRIDSFPTVGADWDAVFHSIEQSLLKGHVEINTACLVMRATRIEGVWHLRTEKGDFFAKALVVATPPWQAAPWLDKAEWPASTHPLVTKTKPVSVVTLSERLTEESPLPSLPGVTLIPAEGVQVYSIGKELCYQATIDYELTLQAPAVGKAIRQLKRARKKLSAFTPYQGTGEHIALVPVAWAQSPVAHDTKIWDRLGSFKHNRVDMGFAGDAYGASFNGDLNLVQAVLSVADVIGTGKAARVMQSTEPEQMTVSALPESMVPESVIPDGGTESAETTP